MMNKVKLFAFYQWAAGLWTEWLDRVDRKGILRNPLHAEAETAVGRRIRVLIAPLGSDALSHFHTFILRRSIKRSFGHAVDIVSGTQPIVWKEEYSFAVFAQQFANAQQLLRDSHCDILVVRRPAAGRSPLLVLVSAEWKRSAPYSQIEKILLPVFFSWGSRHVLAARLFIAMSRVAHIGDDLRVPLFRKLMNRVRPTTSGAPQIRRSLLVNQAFIHRFLGESGSTQDLKEAAQIYHAVLEEFDRDRDPLAWAAVQDDLGNVLRLIGEREQDLPTLQQALAAFNEALSERTPERTDMLWVATQSSFAATLMSLGALKQTARLEEAVTVLRAAVAVCPREHAPLDRARLQHELGRALLRLSTQSKDTACLEQAIAAFRAALEERQNEQFQTQWAMTQHNLASALLILGTRNKGSAELHEAVTAFRAALLQINRHVHPQQWSAIQHNLGTALATIGQREADRAYLQQAVAYYREALKVRVRKRFPAEWAATQSGLGTALLRIGELESDPATLGAAVSAFKEALLERTWEATPLEWATTQSQLGAALSRLSELESGTAHLEQAITAYKAALNVYEKGSTHDAAKAVRASLTAAEARLQSQAEG